MRATALQRTGVLWGVSATLLAMVSVQSGAAIAITLFATVGPLGVVAVRLATAGAFLVSTARPPRRRCECRGPGRLSSTAS